MKLVVIKKGTKKWTAAKAEDTSSCCMMIEGAYWPCFEVAIDN